MSCCSPNGLDSIERPGSDRIEWRVHRVPITLNRVQVTINRTSDQDLTPQMSQNGSHACIEEQMCEDLKPGKQRGLDENDVECQEQASS